MASSKLIGFLFMALLITDLAFAARSSHRRLRSWHANGSSSFGTGSSWSSSSSVSGSFGDDGSASAGAGGSAYEGGVDDRRFEYGGRRCVRYRYGGQSYSGGSGRGGGDSNHFKVVTRGWSGRVGGGDAGGGKGSSTIHRQEANKGGLE